MMLMFIRPKGCLHCKGDLVLADEEWMCVQCGRYKRGVITNPLDHPTISRVKTPMRKLPGGWHTKDIDDLKWPDGLKSWKW